MAQTTWTGNGDGTSWSDAGNWDNGIPGPGNGYYAIFSNVTIAVANIGAWDYPDILEIKDNANVVISDDIEIYDELLVESNSQLSTGDVSVTLSNAYVQLTQIINNGHIDFSNAHLILYSESGGGGRDPIIPGVVTIKSVSDIEIKHISFTSATNSGEFNFEGLGGSSNFTVTNTATKVSNIAISLNNAAFGYSGTESKLVYEGANKTIGNEWPTSINPPHNVTIQLSSTTNSVTGVSSRAIDGTLNMTTGILDLGNNTMQVRGQIAGSDVEGNGTIHSNTTLFLGCTSNPSVHQQITGSIKLTKFRVNKSNGSNDEANMVRLGSSAQITFESSDGFFRIENGIMDLNGRNVNNRSNASLEIQTGGKILTGGTDIREFNAYNVANGTIEYSGNAGEVQDDFSVIATIILNNSSSQGVTLSENVIISNELSLQNGVLNTGSNAITVSDGATISGGSANSFVVGKLRHEFSEVGSKIYPVGVAGRYRPATFNYTDYNAGSGNSIIEIEYSIAGFTPLSPPSGIGEVSAEGHYRIYERGNAPSSFEYDFTGDYTDITLEPEDNLRMLVQLSGQYLYEPGQSVDVFNTHITVIGLTVLPDQSSTPRMVFAVSGGLIFFTNNGSTTSWYDEENWSGGFLPGSADEVEIQDHDVIIGSGAQIEIASLQLRGTARLSITSDNTTDRALVIGSGSGSETVLLIEEQSELVINGGSGKALSIHPGGSEVIEVFGKLTVQAAEGLGSGSSSLPGSRTVFHSGSLYQHFIDTGFWQPATEYGTLEISSASSKSVNHDMIIHQDLKLQQLALHFASGSTADQTLEVKGDINLNSGAELTISNTSNTNTLKLHGNIFADGGMLSTSNRKVNLEFAGEDQQTIPSFISEISRLSTSGGGKKLQSNLTVLDELMLHSGYLDTDEHTVTIGNAETMGNVAATEGYVIGNLRRHIHSGHTEELQFPVGNREDEITTHNRPVRITFGSGGPTGNGTLTARFVQAAPTKSGLPLYDDDLKIENIGVSGYWQILEEDLGDINYDITVEARNFIGVQNLVNLRLLKRDNEESPWELAGVHGEVSGTTEEPVISRMGITAFSEFAIGGDEENTLPVELAHFGVEEPTSASHATLRWTTSTELENYGFEVQRRSASNDSWSVLEFIHGQGTVFTPTEYTYEDRKLSTAGTYQYRIVQIDYDGTRTEYYEAEFTFEAPREFRLLSNYPNPFNPATTIPFQLADDVLVNIAVYDILGQRVQVLINEHMQAGRYETRFDASSLSSGIYLIRFTGGGHTQTMKVSLVK